MENKLLPATLTSVQRNSTRSEHNFLEKLPKVCRVWYQHLQRDFSFLNLVVFLGYVLRQAFGQQLNVWACSLPVARRVDSHENSNDFFFHRILSLSETSKMSELLHNFDLLRFKISSIMFTLLLTRKPIGHFNRPFWHSPLLGFTNVSAILYLYEPAWRKVWLCDKIFWL